MIKKVFLELIVCLTAVSLNLKTVCAQQSSENNNQVVYELPVLGYRTNGKVCSHAITAVCHAHAASGTQQMDIRFWRSYTNIEMSDSKHYEYANGFFQIFERDVSSGAYRNPVSASTILDQTSLVKLMQSLGVYADTVVFEKEFITLLYKKGNPLHVAPIEDALNQAQDPKRTGDPADRPVSLIGDSCSR